jgi:hypothetical protein
MAGSFIDQITTVCTPSQVNLFIGVIGCAIALSTAGFAVSFAHLFVVLIWCLVLNYLCSVGWKNAAWFLVLWPFIMLILGLFIWLIAFADAGITNFVDTAVGIPHVTVSATPSH